MKEIFGSKIKTNEIILVLKDLKTVARQGFYPHELPKVKEFCEKNNLFCELSPYKILMEGENFSDKGTKVDKNHPKGMLFVYISKDQKQALLANLYETKGDHYNLGLTLGYPECCCKFYQEQFEKGNISPEHNNYHDLINIKKRKSDSAIISHFPCQPDCQKSIELANVNLSALKHQNPGNF